MALAPEPVRAIGATQTALWPTPPGGVSTPKGRGAQAPVSAAPRTHDLLYPGTEDLVVELYTPSHYHSLFGTAQVR